MSAPIEQHDDDGTEMPLNEDTASSQQSDFDSDAPEDFHAREVALMRARLQSAHNPIEEADFDAIIGPAQPTFTATWKEDEDLMLSEWDSSREKKAYASINVENASLITLWKVCMRILRCTLLDLISLLLHLKYSPSPMVFSQEFCDALTPLTMHGLWQGSAIRLATALQYAVICCTDDRRAWRLDLLVSSMGERSSMLRPIHQMHREARQRVDLQGQDSGVMSDVLYQVGENVGEKNWAFKNRREH